MAVAVAIPITMAVALLVAAAPPVVAAVAVAVASCALALGLCRLLAAHDADTGEERWLRHVLASLRPGEQGDEDEDHGLLVY